eukprot:10614010-Alexandrium_andersonii.AAC.1
MLRAGRCGYMLIPVSTQAFRNCRVGVQESRCLVWPGLATKMGWSLERVCECASRRARISAVVHHVR